MCMDGEEVRKIIDDTMKPFKDQLSKIEKSVEPLPVFLDKLKNYDDIQKDVTRHEHLICGINGNPGIIDHIKELKNQGKKVFNWIVKISAFAGTLIGMVAAIKAFFF